MIIPIVSIPPSIANGLKHYKDLFPRSKTFQHIAEYCTGMVVLDKPSIKRISQCLVDGPCQSSLNKSITASPWSEESVNHKRLESIQQYHNNGFTVGIIDTTLFHHPRGQNIYGVYKYWDYINKSYTYAIQLVTAAISTNDRLDGFDYRIYHRSFLKQEQLYLEHTVVPAEEQNVSILHERLTELLNFQLHKQQAKTKNQLAVELIDEMESSDLAPDAYAIDSGLFDPVVIERIQQAQKPWVADSEKNRILYHKGQSYNCETFNQTIPKESFRETTISIRHQEQTRWMFTSTVRIRRYGKVRFAIIYDNPDKQGEPIYVFTDMLVWNNNKILSVRSHRWDIEPFHEQIKQFLGAEDSQLQTEQGVRKHLTLVFVVNSLLKSIDLSSPIGDLPMDSYKDVQSTFGQRCRRIVFEVFHEMIQKIHQWVDTKSKTVTEIFQTLFQRLLYA
jgi:Transposase DDE domain